MNAPPMILGIVASCLVLCACDEARRLAADAHTSSVPDVATVPDDTSVPDDTTIPDDTTVPDDTTRPDSATTAADTITSTPDATTTTTLDDAPLQVLTSVRLTWDLPTDGALPSGPGLPPTLTRLDGSQLVDVAILASATGDACGDVPEGAACATLQVTPRPGREAEVRPTSVGFGGDPQPPALRLYTLGVEAPVTSGTAGATLTAGTVTLVLTPADGGTLLPRVEVTINIHGRVLVDVTLGPPCEAADLPPDAPGQAPFGQPESDKPKDGKYPYDESLVAYCAECKQKSNPNQWCYDCAPKEADDVDACKRYRTVDAGMYAYCMEVFQRACGIVHREPREKFGTEGEQYDPLDPPAPDELVENQLGSRWQPAAADEARASCGEEPRWRAGVAELYDVTDDALADELAIEELDQALAQMEEDCRARIACLTTPRTCASAGGTMSRPLDMDSDLDGTSPAGLSAADRQPAACCSELTGPFDFDTNSDEQAWDKSGFKEGRDLFGGLWGIGWAAGHKRKAWASLGGDDAAVDMGAYVGGYGGIQAKIPKFGGGLLWEAIAKQVDTYLGKDASKGGKFWLIKASADGRARLAGAELQAAFGCKLQVGTKDVVEFLPDGDLKTIYNEVCKGFDHTLSASKLDKEWKVPLFEYDLFEYNQTFVVGPVPVVVGLGASAGADLVLGWKFTKHPGLNLYAGGAGHVDLFVQGGVGFASGPFAAFVGIAAYLEVGRLSIAGRAEGAWMTRPPREPHKRVYLRGCFDIPVTASAFAGRVDALLKLKAGFVSIKKKFQLAKWPGLRWSSIAFQFCEELCFRYALPPDPRDVDGGGGGGDPEAGGDPSKPCWPYLADEAPAAPDGSVPPQRVDQYADAGYALCMESLDARAPEGVDGCQWECGLTCDNPAWRADCCGIGCPLNPVPICAEHGVALGPPVGHTFAGGSGGTGGQPVYDPTWDPALEVDCTCERDLSELAYPGAQAEYRCGGETCGGVVCAAPCEAPYYPLATGSPPLAQRTPMAATAAEKEAWREVYFGARKCP